MGAKKKAARHANCPPPIWDGLEWRCMNHGNVGEVVAKTRGQYLAETQKGGHKQKPRGAGVLVPAEQAELRREFDTLAVLVRELHERIGKLERAKKK